MAFNTIEEAIEDLKRGKVIIVVDDEDRENEGDFVVAAEKCTPEVMNFLITYGKGIPCVATTRKRLEELQLPPMVSENTARLGTAMSVTVDARHGTTTGISAYDRARTVAVFVDPNAKPSDLMRPGHIIPLQAVEGGVLRRAGHTEATVDLCKLAGFQPVGVLCEIVGEDGSMARLPELQRLAQRFDLKIITVADLIAFRRRTERLVRRVATTRLPTQRYGELIVHAYETDLEPTAVVAFVKGDLQSVEAPLVRVHSSCVTGDLLDSLRCDCGSQLQLALQKITEEGCGALIYLEQEGRGIGLINKLRAYELQEKGADTVEANELLGFKPDLRDYGIGAQVMVDLGLKKIRFMTNNPRKVAGLEGYGLSIVEHVPLRVPPNPHNIAYLRTKREKLGHIFTPEDLVLPDNAAEPSTTEAVATKEEK
ncbi:MAG TPA: bifunctional 3,4-dihydroxy-2-butanone-4-phosphate synthase/GTP cyclohydrolase II [Chthonomonas sp.]|jgi:3,4-dihydroxy 2-butanone 4-phosphate synthase/GTP cyclohydrolase II|uniref:bifunctional 3,4-dihydroxy-2-butanone-4-phosphate synthase/GTP cyclohydrolase II n=1 Tax=Chthonomonas sp. TaxID=2282153 RepID=UPI002B4B8E6F|nr:bifunctional 3,4-dihydroxy-2-butanone-4-phosphate synthase/GTP cyclohydrolase II [Chthonomonas sp.]HLH79807.1 bifunctional 3,4-dihydroxy-2-butanone-4-phosphate synthase/GTP cyclohydrolase II [Chthonomonas sp.]